MVIIVHKTAFALMPDQLFSS